MKEDGDPKRVFKASLKRYLTVSTAVIAPCAILVSWILASWRGVAGSAVGLLISLTHSLVALRVVAWALGKPPSMLPAILLSSYALRTLVLAAILYGVHFIKALNMISLLLSFLVLYMAHIGSEMLTAARSFGVSIGSPEDR